MQVLSKSSFAREVRVSPACVTQWIAKGTIGPDAIVGEGPKAKIIVETAIAQIRLRRDPGQGLGNGIGTRVSAPHSASEPPSKAAAGPATFRHDDVVSQIQIERLESAKRTNRQAAIDQAVREGKLTSTDEARAAMIRMAQQIDQENAAMLADYASAIAGRFGVPQRDVLHLLREVRNEKKAIAAARVRARDADISDTVEMVIEEGIEQ